MKFTKLYYVVSLILFSLFTLQPAIGQTNPQGFIYGDMLPDAPELAERGRYKVGVMTLNLLHKDQPDVANFSKDEKPIYDRPLKVEEIALQKLHMRILLDLQTMKTVHFLHFPLKEEQNETHFPKMMKGHSHW